MNVNGFQRPRRSNILADPPPRRKAPYPPPAFHVTRDGCVLGSCYYWLSGRAEWTFRAACDRSIRKAIRGGFLYVDARWLAGFEPSIGPLADEARREAMEGA